MTDVEETILPGVGVRHDFQTASGRRVGVIVHHSGRRELLIYDDRDPDLCRETLRIDEREALTLGEMLGAAQVQQANVEALQQSIEGLTIDWLQIDEGLTIDWLQIDEGSSFAGRTIGELGLRERTGITVIAVIRDEVPLPSPGPDVRLEAHDTAVVVGSRDAIGRAFALLHDS